VTSLPKQQNLASAFLTILTLTSVTPAIRSKFSMSIISSAQGTALGSILVDLEQHFVSDLLPVARPLGRKPLMHSLVRSSERRWIDSGPRCGLSSDNFLEFCSTRIARTTPDSNRLFSSFVAMNLRVTV
jgi:hypothetical protein